MHSRTCTMLNASSVRSDQRETSPARSLALLAEIRVQFISNYVILARCMLMRHVDVAMKYRYLQCLSFDRRADTPSGVTLKIMLNQYYRIVVITYLHFLSLYLKIHNRTTGYSYFTPRCMNWFIPARFRTSVFGSLSAYKENTFTE